MDFGLSLWQVIDIIIKLILAVLCGGLVGLIKNVNRESITFSSLILTCFTAALLVLALIQLNNILSGMDLLQYGIAAIIIGFAIIGAAIIIGGKSTLQSVIDALTILAVAGMGIAIGTGIFIVGIIAGVLLSILLNVMHRIFISGNQNEI